MRWQTWSRAFAVLLLVALVLAAGGCRREEGYRTHFDPRKPAGPAPYAFQLRAGEWDPSAAKVPLGARGLLKRNGFVVLTGAPQNSLQAAYLETGKPFITADAVLYVFGALFRGGLHDFERARLVPATRRLVEAGLRATEADYTRRRQQAGLAEAAKDNLVLFAVAGSLLGQEMPAEVAQEAGAIAGKIREAKETNFYPGEDYAVYRVRGDYAGQPELEAYFRVTKWLSRVILTILPGTERPADADTKLRQAVLLGELLRSDAALGRAWRELRDETSFLLGRPDSFTPLEVAEVADRVLPAGYLEGASPALGQASALTALRAEFAKPQYPASAIIPVPAAAPEDVPSKYAQLLGERWIVDGAIMQRTCYPYVRKRFLPTGLDVATVLFPQGVARKYLGPELSRYPALGKELDDLTQRYGQTGRDRWDTIYEGWLGALGKLTPPESPHLPRFLKTEAWRDKCLNTALASWAQLRHDFILYAKEPMIPGCAGMEVYVEPLPEFYGRMGELARELDGRGFGAMADLAHLCENLRKVAQAELERGSAEDVKLPDQEAFYIGSFGQWLLKYFTRHVAQEQPALVADVAGNWRGEMLHAATGPLYPVVVEVKYRGQDVQMVGYVMSYYEFALGSFRRMTDQEWVEQVNAGKHRASAPPWTASFAYPGPEGGG